MPIFWRYLLKNYLKIFFLSLFSFIGALLAIRFEAIIQLISLTQNSQWIAKFIIYQIPYILPIAIPVAGLIAAMVLSNKFSSTNELTALRMEGLSLFSIYTPLLLCSFFFSSITFFVASEWTPQCRKQAEIILQQSIASNPLLLLQKKKLLKLEDCYVELDYHQKENHGKQLLLAFKDQAKCHLRICLANCIEVKDHYLIGHCLSFISYLPSPNPDTFDHLFIENQEKMETDFRPLLQMVTRPFDGREPEHLRCFELLHEISDRLPKGTPRFYLAKFELYRRLYFSCMTIAFTFLGLTFGTQIGRRKSSFSYAITTALAILSLVGPIAAKSLLKLPLISLICLTFPIILTFACSILYLQKINRGAE